MGAVYRVNVGVGMRGLSGLSVGIVMAVLSAAPVMAQSEQDFINAFAGDWQVVDDRFAAGDKPCSLVLEQETPTSGRYPVTMSGCGSELAKVGAWGISDGQMTLFDGTGAQVAKLGGNQRRMSGDSAGGAPIILERVGVSGFADTLAAAKQASGCFYSGFTDKCAAEAQLAKPAGDAPKVGVLVNLNIRAEARDDATVVGVVPAGTCVATELCMSATDGVWCRARFNDVSGWLRKLALRQNRWPVVTFDNSCG